MASTSAQGNATSCRLRYRSSPNTLLPPCAPTGFALQQPGSSKHKSSLMFQHRQPVVILQGEREGQSRGGWRGGGGSAWPRSEGPQRMVWDASESSLGAAGCQQHITTSARLILPSPLPPPRPTAPLQQFLQRGKCASKTSLPLPVIDQSRWLLSWRPGVGRRQELSPPSDSSRKHAFLPYHRYIVFFSQYGAANISTNHSIVSFPQKGIKETDSSSPRCFLLVG